VVFSVSCCFLAWPVRDRFVSVSGLVVSVTTTAIETCRRHVADKSDDVSSRAPPKTSLMKTFPTKALLCYDKKRIKS